MKPGIELNFTTKARAHTQQQQQQKTRANYVIGNNNEN